MFRLLVIFASLPSLTSSCEAQWEKFRYNNTQERTRISRGSTSVRQSGVIYDIYKPTRPLSGGCTEMPGNYPGWKRSPYGGQYLVPTVWWQLDLRRHFTIYNVRTGRLSHACHTCLYHDGTRPIIVMRVSNTSLEDRGPPTNHTAVDGIQGLVAMHENTTICDAFNSEESPNTHYCRNLISSRFLSIEIEPEVGKVAGGLSICSLSVTGFRKCLPGERTCYLEQCECLNPEECQRGHIFGWCRSGCRLGYHGDYCEEKIEYLVDRSNDSLRIERLLASLLVRMRSTVRYQLQTRVHGNQTLWKELIYNVTAETFALDKLDLNSSHEFRLRFLRTETEISEREVVVGGSRVITRCGNIPGVDNIRFNAGPIAAALSWNKPDYVHCPIPNISYKLTIYPLRLLSCGGRSWLFKTKVVDGTEHVLEELAPYSLHKVEITPIARDEFGVLGAKTTSIEFETLSDTPDTTNKDSRPFMPRKEHNSLSSTSVRLKFRPISCRFQKGPFRHFLFTILDLLRNATRFIKVTNSSQTVLQVEELKPRTTYNISLTWVNDLGSSLPSEPLTVITEKSRPSPPTIHLIRTTGGTVGVRVQFPKHPKAKLVQLVVNCTITNFTKQQEKELMFRRVLVEKTESLDIEGVVVRGVERIRCEATVHSDKGPSAMAETICLMGFLC